MICAEYSLIDRGYEAVADGTPLAEIYGLDNLEIDGIDLRFRHRGLSGYPAGASLVIERPDQSGCLAWFDGTPDDGGVEIPAEDVVALLVSDYGYPANTTIGEDGRPVVTKTY